MGKQTIKKTQKDFRIFDYPKDSIILEDFFRNGSIRIIDHYKEQLQELYDIKHPADFVNKNNLYLKNREEEISSKIKKDLKKKLGKWIWYPWNNALVHIVDDEQFQELRTSRNKNLINSKEQQKFRKLRVSIAGLSVGNSIAITTRILGGCQTMTLADPDVLEVSNLNRIRCGITELGVKKVQIAKQQILEIDPYSQITSYEEGVRDDNMEDFIRDTDVIIDEVDDLSIKVKIRLAARKKGIPVLMITDNNDGVLIDYYPYNKCSTTPLFHGIDDNEMNIFLTSKKINKEEMVKISSKIVGKDNISPRMLDSLNEIGNTLTTWPQLGTAAIFAGVVASYLLRQISIGKDINITRKLITLNNIIPCC